MLRLSGIENRPANLERLSRFKLAAGVLAPAGYALAGPASAWLGPRHALAVAAGLALASVGTLMCFAEVRRFGARASAAA